MNTFRRAFSLIMALVLLFSLSLSVFAADYTAADPSELYTAFSDTSGENVNINITANINGGNYTAQDGINYNIYTENNSSLITPSFDGSGSVEVNTQVEDNIVTFEDVSVTINGDTNADITAYDNSTISITGNADDDVAAYDEASITVAGNVDGYVSTTDEATITVGGDVTYSASADGNSSVAVNGNIDSAFAYENSSISVAGDLLSYANALDNAIVTVGGDAHDGLFAFDNSSISVAGNVGGLVNTSDDAQITVGGNANSGINAEDNSFVTVKGSVNGENGDPDDVDYTDPEGYSDGYTAISAYDNATVTVGGNVTGGNSYGTFGYGGTGVYAEDFATVTVGGDVTGGNVIADPNTEAIEGGESFAGTGIFMSNTATVSVGGKVTGGKTNGDQGYGGSGVVIDLNSNGESGSISVKGTVAAGMGENKDSGTDLILLKEFTESYTPAMPSIKFGYCETISGEGFEVGELESLTEALRASFVKDSAADFFWADVMKQIRAAKAGDEITIDVKNRTKISAAVIEAARDQEVTLIIKWNGGDDLVITKDFTEEVRGFILLKDLAEMLKK